MYSLYLQYRKKAIEDNNPVLRDQSLKLLIDTVKQLNPSSVLEIGTNVGLSGIAMLLASKNAKLTGIEIDEEKFNEAKSNYKTFGVEDRAKIFLGDASEIIPVLTGKYDLIFLDGPKGHYFEYLPYLVSALNVGGVLFSDNVLFRGFVKGKAPHRFMTIKNSMSEFLGYFENNEDFEFKLYDIEDGVSIAKKLR